MRRTTKAALVILVVGAAMAGVSTVPRSEDTPVTTAPPLPPVAVEDGAPTAAIRSSTRGSVAVVLPEGGGGGTPFDPGGQAAAATSGTTATTEGDVVRRPVGGESVIGADNRVWMRNRTTTYPNAAIGRLDFRQDGRSYWCTGTLIDADTVLTAGHCVHDGLSGLDGWSTSVRFTPGAEGNRAPFGSCHSRELLALPGWFERGAEYQDLGLVHLDCRVGEVVGWFGYRSAPGAKGIQGVVAHVRGYPGDKVWSSLWNMRDRIRVSQGRMAFYAADTYGGQSGSPVFNFKRCNDGRGPCILAVHAYGTHRGAPHHRYNHGPRLDEERVALISALAAG